MLRGLFDCLVVPPADLFAYILLLPIGFAPIVAAAFTWTYLLKFIDEKLSTETNRTFAYIVAALISGYVLLMASTALVRLPHVAYEVFARESDN